MLRSKGATNARTIHSLIYRPRGEEAVEDDEALMDAVCGCVTQLLPTLKPEYAEALRDVDLEEMSVKAYAEKRGITANNASVRLHRSREALRRQVQRSCGTCADHGCLDCSCGRPGKGAV